MKCIQILLIVAATLTLPLNVLAISRLIHTEWQYQYTDSVTGFRLYRENSPICETNDSTATSMDCTVDAPDGESTFTITALLPDGTEKHRSVRCSCTKKSDICLVSTLVRPYTMSHHMNRRRLHSQCLSL